MGGFVVPVSADTYYITNSVQSSHHTGGNVSTGGRAGADGQDGADGAPGQPGRDGRDGADGTITTSVQSQQRVKIVTELDETIIYAYDSTQSTSTDTATTTYVAATTAATTTTESDAVPRLTQIFDVITRLINEYVSRLW